MASMHRKLHLPLSAVSALWMAGCSSPLPVVEGYDCDYANSAIGHGRDVWGRGGVLVCNPRVEGSSGSGDVSVTDTSTESESGTISVPGLDSEGGGIASEGGGSDSPVSVPELGVPDNPTLVEGADPGDSMPDNGGEATDPGNAGENGGETNAPVDTTLARIRVSALDLARDHSIVSFALPDGAGKTLALEDEAGNRLPLQMDSDGNATFVLPSLGAGQQANYTVEELPQGRPPLVRAAVESNQLFVTMGDSRVFRWVLTDDNFRNRAANNVRSGYIYPLYTPGGLNVADDYAEDHPHMHGIWSAWTSTTFRGHKVDFWNGYANQGHIDLESMEGAWSGAVHAGLIANLKHDDITTDPDVTVLREQWVVTVYKTHEGAAPYYIFDIDSTQEAATGDPLILDQYHYGGFGFRGAADWAVGANVSYLTSEGHTRQNADGQNARWVAQFGNVGGQVGGYAALGHPANLRAPQGLRVHPSNPYWAFVPVTPLKGGRYNIEPGVPYRSHFRIVSFDGPANADLINRIWSDYATPPTVEVLPPE